ncbi:hypothetical protein EYF80_011248 [Liparis tanakae]|uniref:Uncharacterized protein n=1 Tax=Liparis tanakae TaxID=230148 RepID=A0A4Z2IKX4_9TELE|nr:hypothetical protein EYF80_011248 [Liparis tanakae]
MENTSDNSVDPGVPRRAQGAVKPTASGARGPPPPDDGGEVAGHGEAAPPLIKRDLSKIAALRSGPTGAPLIRGQTLGIVSASAAVDPGGRVRPSETTALIVRDGARVHRGSGPGGERQMKKDLTEKEEGAYIKEEKLFRKPITDPPPHWFHHLRHDCYSLIRPAELPYSASPRQPDICRRCVGAPRDASGHLWALFAVCGWDS